MVLVLLVLVLMVLLVLMLVGDAGVDPGIAVSPGVAAVLGGERGINVMEIPRGGGCALVDVFLPSGLSRREAARLFCCRCMRTVPAL